jgi:uncharacterized protein YndB with AHSA1/START domain
MQTIHHQIVINAPREKVWDVMLADATYREWTKAFHDGSYYKGDWSEGSKILFIGPDEHGGEMGMVSYVRECRRPEYVSLEHVGIYKDGVEDTTSDDAKKWSPSFENYTFTEVDGGTQVTIDQSIEDEYKDMFDEMWPNALTRLKELVEEV